MVGRYVDENPSTEGQIVQDSMVIKVGNMIKKKIAMDTGDNYFRINRQKFTQTNPRTKQRQPSYLFERPRYQGDSPQEATRQTNKKSNGRIGRFFGF